jgi:hypothetical protein
MNKKQRKKSQKNLKNENKKRFGAFTRSVS